MRQFRYGASCNLYGGMDLEMTVTTAVDVLIIIYRVNNNNTIVINNNRIKYNRNIYNFNTVV